MSCPTVQQHADLNEAASPSVRLLVAHIRLRGGVQQGVGALVEPPFPKSFGMDEAVHV